MVNDREVKLSVNINWAFRNRRPKCKMHSHKKDSFFTRFFCILQLIYKENRTDGIFQNWTETKSQNQTEPDVFLKTELNLLFVFTSRLSTL